MKRDIPYWKIVEGWFKEITTVVHNMMTEDINFKTGYYYKNYQYLWDYHDKVMIDHEKFIIDKMDIFNLIVKDIRYNEEILSLYENKFGKADEIFPEEIKELNGIYNTR